MQQREAAGELLLCLQAFAAQRSNPVLVLLGAERRLVAGRRYPQPALCFAGGRWRAYYHHHDGQPLAPGEHGHFHVFVRAPRTAGQDPAAPRWAHLAGLGMDGHGQPLRWFAVNAWVTDDAWLPRDWLLARLDELEAGEGSLLPAWLCAMLCLHREDLAGLLTARDQAIAAAAAGRDHAAALADRGFYQLADRPLDLQGRLETLLGTPPGGAG